MEKTNFLQNLKDKGSYYLIIVVLVVIVVYVGFLFYINNIAMGTKDKIDPAKGLEKTRLSDLNLSDFEKTNYYKFQEINQENYPDKLPEEQPYNDQETNFDRQNPFISEITSTSSAKTTNVAKTQTTNQTAKTTAPAVQDLANTQSASVSDFSYIPTDNSPTLEQTTQEETFGAPTGEDFNFNFNITQ
jgi:hypothetical protein